MVDIVAGTEIQTSKLMGPEVKRWNDFWAMQGTLTTIDGPVPFWPDYYMNAAKTSVEMYKFHARQREAEFHGTNPRKGFGVRGILPFDVFGAGAAEQDWDADTAYQLGERSWIGGTGPDASTFGNDTFIKTHGTNDNNEIWYVFIMGFMDRTISPRTGSLLLNIDNEQQALIEVETSLTLSEMQVHWLSSPILITNIRPIKLGVHYPVAATGRLFPIGFSIVDSNRAKVRDLSLMDRPTVIA